MKMYLIFLLLGAIPFLLFFGSLVLWREYSSPLFTLLLLPILYLFYLYIRKKERKENSLFNEIVKEMSDSDSSHTLGDLLTYLIFITGIMILLSFLGVLIKA